MKTKTRNDIIVKAFTLAVILLTFILTPEAKAEQPSFEPYAYTNITLIDGDDTPLEPTWTKVGFYHRQSVEGAPGLFTIRYEANINNDHSISGGYRYIQWNLEGLSLAIGRSLDFSQFGYPGPESLPTTRWQSAEGGLPVYSTGLRGTYTTNMGTVGLSLSNDMNDRRYLGAYAHIGCAQLFYSEYSGMGFVANKDLTALFNPGVGGTDYIDGHTAWWIGNRFSLSERVQLHSFYDFGNVDESLVCSLNYNYAPNSAVKLGYDTLNGRVSLNVSLSLHGK